MADQSKTTRTELKSFFVQNAIPTADDFVALIESGLNQFDDGVRIEAGKVTVAGAIEAKAGLAVTGAPVMIGAPENKQSLTVNGAVTASDLFTAQSGLTVSSGAVLLNTSATVAGQLTASGQVNAQANLALTGTLTAVGGAVTIGDTATNLPMTVHHALTVNRETALNKGLTVKGGGVNIGDSSVPQSVIVSGASNLQGGATILNGLTVSTGTTTFGALVDARAGLTVKNAPVTIGEPSSKQDLTINGAVTASEMVTANKGLTVNTSPLVVNTGLNVWGGPVNVGSPSVNQNLTVNGIVYGKTFMLAAPTGDNSPSMTSRVIPAGQGAANEATEVILFHGDDYTGSGFGPDYITLRAPAIRLQTYANVGVPTIDNVQTSNTRINIDSFGAITASGTLTVSGATTSQGYLTANASMTVTGMATVNGAANFAQTPRSGTHLGTILGLYVTGEFGDSLGVEFRHSNGSQGIGFGLNTIYATGNSTDQPLRLKARGNSSVEVLGNLSVSGVVSGPPNDYTKAQFTMSGGGVVTWVSGRLKWANRFIVISAGNAASTILSGYVNVVMPIVDIPGSNVYDGAPRSVSAAGILLKDWEALYAVHTVGGNADSVTFRIVLYNIAHTVPSNWLLVAVRNNDDNSIKLGTGQTIHEGGQVIVTGPVTAGGLLTANVGLTVTGTTTMNGALSIAQVPRSGSHLANVLGAYITGDFGESAGVEIRHTNGTQGIGFGYNTIYAAGSSTDQALRLKARGAGSVEVLGNLVAAANLNVLGSLAGPPHDYVRAQCTLSGGGTITWSGGRLKWTSRFLAISMGTSSSFSAGHIAINMPTADLPGANVHDSIARSVNASGIVLNPYEAIYAVHTVGQNEIAVQLRIVRYNVPHAIPANWLLIAVMNNDDGSSIKLGTGQVITNGNSVTVLGPLDANAGLTVTGGGVMIGTAGTNQSLTVFGGATVHNNLTVTGGGINVSGIANFNTGLTVQSGPLWSNGLVTANAGLTVSTGPLWSHTLVTANAGLNVNSGPLWSNTLVTANAGLNVNGGPLWSNTLVTANAGLTVVGAPLTVNNVPVVANAGVIVNNGVVQLGSTPVGPGMLVNGTAMVNTLAFLPLPGDPSPVITARMIPSGQGASNEATELILFHSNDNGSNGAGPDLITLRSPGIRFQTYNDPGVGDINHPGGSQTRVYIEPTGPVNMYQGLLRLGTGANVTPGTVTAVVGCLGQGVTNGQLAYRAGYGFELIDCSGPGPLMNYGRDQFPYTDLRLRVLQYQNLAQFSSRTLKEDIRDLSAEEALDAFQHLNPVTYRMKADSTGRTHAGFIAEDVPALASIDDHKAIAPVDILAVLTRVVHTQQESIRQLEQRIAALTPA